MSYAHISRIRRINEEYRAARASVQFALSRWPVAHLDDEFADLGLQQLSNARRALEPTFVIRLFSEFEGCLHQYLAAAGRLPAYPTANSLIDRTSSRLKVDAGLTTGVHRVRKYRNKLVHIRGEEVEEILIDDVRKSLNLVLNYLP